MNRLRTNATRREAGSAATGHTASTWSKREEEEEREKEEETGASRLLQLESLGVITGLGKGRTVLLRVGLLWALWVGLLQLQVLLLLLLLQPMLISLLLALRIHWKSACHRCSRWYPHDQSSSC